MGKYARLRHQHMSRVLVRKPRLGGAAAPEEPGVARSKLLDDDDDDDEAKSNDNGFFQSDSKPRDDDDDEPGDFDDTPARATRRKPPRVVVDDFDDESGDFDDAPGPPRSRPPRTGGSGEVEDDRRLKKKQVLEDEENGPSWRRLLTGGEILSEDSDDSDEDYSDADAEERAREAFEEYVMKHWTVPEGVEAPTQPIEEYDDGLTDEEARMHHASMCVDEEGRIMIEGGVSARLDFEVLSFDAMIGGDTNALQRDCERLATADKDGEEAYSSGSTYWVPATARRNALSALEALALDIFDFHVQKHVEERSEPLPLDKCGAEWWTLAMDAGEGEVGWHWDRDYSVEERGVNISPHLATVTYLNDAGAPTIVLPIVAPPDQRESFSGKTPSVFISLPRAGKHISFDGRFLHAAVDELLVEDDAPLRSVPYTPAGRRVTLLVNIWLDWHPETSVELPEKVRATLAKSEAVKFAPTRDDPFVSNVGVLRVASGFKPSSPSVWRFRTPKHKAKVAISLPEVDLSRTTEESTFLFEREPRQGSKRRKAPLAVVLQLPPRKAEPRLSRGQLLLNRKKQRRRQLLAR